MFLLTLFLTHYIENELNTCQSKHNKNNKISFYYFIIEYNRFSKYISVYCVPTFKI